MRGCARVVVEKHPRSLIRTYQTYRQKAGMTSNPKRPRDDLFRSCRARWVHREPGRIADLGLAELGEGEMTSHDISTFLAIPFLRASSDSAHWVAFIEGNRVRPAGGLKAKRK